MIPNLPPQSKAKILYLTLVSFQHGCKQHAFQLIRSTKLGLSKRILKKMRQSHNKSSNSNSNQNSNPKIDMSHISASSKDLSYSASSIFVMSQQIGVNTESNIAKQSKRIIDKMREVIGCLQGEVQRRDGNCYGSGSQKGNIRNAEGSKGKGVIVRRSLERDDKEEEGKRDFARVARERQNRIKIDQQSNSTTPIFKKKRQFLKAKRSLQRKLQLQQQSTAALQKRLTAQINNPRNSNSFDLLPSYSRSTTHLSKPPSRRPGFSFSRLPSYSQPLSHSPCSHTCSTHITYNYCFSPYQKPPYY